MKAGQGGILRWIYFSILALLRGKLYSAFHFRKETSLLGKTEAPSASTKTHFCPLFFNSSSFMLKPEFIQLQVASAVVLESGRKFFFSPKSFFFFEIFGDSKNK